MKPRDMAVLFGTIGFSVLIVIAAVLWRRDTRQAVEPPPEQVPGQAETIPAPPPEGALEEPSQEEQREVTLFFLSPGGYELRAEKRRIFLAGTITDQARQTVAELIDGPGGDLLPTLPPSTEVRRVFLTADGTAFVDFSRSFVDGHVGGSSGEIETVFSLVDTLAFNFPEIRRVRILVEGEERTTLQQHLDLSRSFRPDMSIVALGEEF